MDCVRARWLCPGGLFQAAKQVCMHERGRCRRRVRTRAEALDAGGPERRVLQSKLGVTAWPHTAPHFSPTAHVQRLDSGWQLAGVVARDHERVHHAWRRARVYAQACPHAAQRALPATRVGPSNQQLVARHFPSLLSRTTPACHHPAEADVPNLASRGNGYVPSAFRKHLAS